MTAFDFSTDEFPEHERIAAWREMFGAKIVKLDMEPPKDQPFRGRVTIKALPDLAIGSITEHGQSDLSNAEPDCRRR